MNKYMGFYELKSINIPTVDWKQFTLQTRLDENLLWTLRVAVEHKNDLNLPRYVGIKASDAYNKGRELLKKYENSGMVIYYPYFIAEKSGVMDVSNQRTVIEAVEKDLWNLVTYGRNNVTIIFENGKEKRIGEHKFLSEYEIKQLRKYEEIFKKRYRNVLSEGSSVFAEWSFAFNTDVSCKPIGNKHLVFYELRSVM